MMTISHTDLNVDEDLGRRILVRARTIAPRLDTLDLVADSERYKDAVAILRGVAADVADRGSAQVSSESIGPARVTYRDIDSAFDRDTRESLRSLFDDTEEVGLPEASFPVDRLFTRLWPDERYES